MNTKLFYLSLIEWAVDLIIGVLALYVTYLFFNAWFKKRYKVEDDNLAWKILMAAILFGTGYCITGALQPVLTTFKLLQAQGLSNGSYIFECIKFVMIFIIIGLFIGILSCFITLVLYNAITRSVDELQEIANGKISYAVFMGTIVIVISLFIRDAYINLLESLIPYPHIPVLPR
jgi:hypothetical protein